VSERRYFGTDGIRDVANSGHLTPDMVLRIGHAIGKHLAPLAPPAKRPRALLVRDTRVSGPMISSILAGTLLAHGVDVFDGGVLPTPACSLLVRRQSFDLGIVVSASHNPMRDNGIKLFGADGRKLKDEDEAAIERWIDRGEAHDVDRRGADLGRKTPYREGEDLYIEAMVQDLFGHLDLAGFRLVVDCAHGAASRVAPRILAAMGADVTTMNAKPDGTNINDSAGVYHAADMAPVIARAEAHLGIALDGDADRVILVDSSGRVCDGDVILAALARALPAGAKREIVVTVMSNMGLHAMARDLGVAVHQTPVGDRYVAERMEQRDVAFGGEQSGHVIFRNAKGWFGDGLYTAMRVIEALGGRPESLLTLHDSMRRFPQVLRNLRVVSKPPIAELAKFQEVLRRHEGALGDDGRILVRYSGTEALARVMVEGREESRIASIAEDLVFALAREIGA
jgi:phosphoglucosamine mutase